MQRWVMAAGMAAGLASGGFVQASAQTTSAQQSGAAGKPAILTVTGCLRNGADPDTYVLSNLKWKEAASPTGTSGSSSSTGSSTASGTTDVPPAAASATTLRLVGTPAVRLGEHVGRIVEITGMLTDESAPSPALSDGGAETRARTGTGGDQTTREERAKTQTRPEQTLSVRTVRAVGGSCTDGTPR